MATKGKTKDPVAAAEQAAAAAEQAAAKKEAGPKTRGPRGVEETAKITVLAGTNPKREGSKAHTVFSHYKTGQTIAEFADSLKASGLEKEATPNLVWDAKHGFIAIEGYNPGEIITPKPKKAPKPKTEKGGKVKVEKDPAAEQAVEAAVQTETVD